MRSSFRAVLLLTFLVSTLWYLRKAAAQTTGQPTPASASTTSTDSVAAANSGTNGAPDIAQLRLMIDRGQFAEALKQLDALAARTPVPAGVNRLRGLALYSENQFAQADAAFAEALTEDPHDVEAAQLRGLTLFRLGKPTEAIPLLESATGWAAHTRVDPSYVLALCYLEVKQYDNARRAFAHQYGFAPDSAPAYLLTARMLLRRDNLPEAKELAAKALEIDPRLPLAHELLGEIALAQQQLSVAIGEFEKERVVDPLDGSVYDRLGDAYIRAGQYNKAEQALQRALLLEPSATGPYILLGRALIGNQDPAGAVMYLQRAEKMDDKNPMTHWLLAQAYRSLGQLDAARRESEITQKLELKN
ncbi:MAG TPA: tetratricopeptide repeat protein [Acidobacteriaceae bacterium]|nr:tetratricopeptide repeat protein [Acidobacteriaceae bacterium]